MTAAFYSTWRKSLRSDGDGNCVEISEADDADTIGVRDSKDPHSIVLEFERATWHFFLDGIRAGAFGPR